LGRSHNFEDIVRSQCRDVQELATMKEFLNDLLNDHPPFAKVLSRWKTIAPLLILLAGVVNLALQSELVVQSKPFLQSTVAESSSTITSTPPPSAGSEFSMLFANADRKIAERKAWLSKKHNEHRQFGQLRGASVWYLFPPVLPCFWSFFKEPSAAVRHDGGKWLCGLNEVHDLRRETTTADYDYGAKKKHYDSKPCIVYSMGSNNDFSFEEQVRMVAPGCEIHTFDPTIKETGKGKNIYDQYHDSYGYRTR
jgi:hypothetical protein